MNNFKQEKSMRPEQFCIQVVCNNALGTKHFENIIEAKKWYPTLDPLVNGKDFTWGMYNGFCEDHKKYQMRFEDWDTNDIMSI